MRKHECVWCDKEGKHFYAQGWLCDECKEKIEKEWKTPKDVPDIMITELDFTSGGQYEHKTGIIGIGHSTFPIEVVINHEVMHHVLNKCISVQSSKCYDFISGCGEIEKEFL